MAANAAVKKQDDAGAAADAKSGDKSAFSSELRKDARDARADAPVHGLAGSRPETRAVLRDDFSSAAMSAESRRLRRIREAFEKCDKNASADLAYYSRDLAQAQQSRKMGGAVMTGLMVVLATASVLAASLPGELLASYGRAVSAGIAVLAVAIIALRSWSQGAGFDAHISVRRGQFEILTEAQREMDLRWKLDVESSDDEAVSAQKGQEIVADYASLISKTRRRMDGDSATVKGHR